MYNNVKKTKNSILTLPRKRTAYTILKSPHADKKAREQFMKELYSVRISIKNYVAIMQYMNSIILSYSKAFIHSYKYAAFYENKI
jgi:ribosomal protein S10